MLCRWRRDLADNDVTEHVFHSRPRDTIYALHTHSRRWIRRKFDQILYDSLRFYCLFKIECASQIEGKI